MLISGTDAMPEYRYCDLRLVSNLVLPELPARSTEQPAISFRCTEAPGEPIEEPGWIEQEPLPDTGPFLRIARRDSSYRLRYHELADFVIDSDGAGIECRRYGPLPDETVRHLLLDQVLPRLLSHQGRLMLHASAVLTPGGLIAFLGDTGWGKSTLAAGLVQPGVALITDDCLYVREIDGALYGIPAYTGLRLLPDSLDFLYPKSPELLAFAHYSDKKRLVVEHAMIDHKNDPLPLLALFILSRPQDSIDNDRVVIEPLSSVETLVALTRHSFKLDFTDKLGISSSFLRLGEMSRLIPAFSLRYPRRPSFLKHVTEAVLDKADQIAGDERL